MPHRNGRLLYYWECLARRRRRRDVAYLREREEDALNVLPSATVMPSIKLSYRKDLAPEETPHLGRTGHDFRLVDRVELGFEGEHARRDKVAEVGGKYADEA